MAFIVECLAAKIGVNGKQALIIQRNEDHFVLKICQDAGACKGGWIFA